MLLQRAGTRGPRGYPSAALQQLSRERVRRRARWRHPTVPTIMNQMIVRPTITNYLWVNSSIGDDNRTREQAFNPSTPWATPGRALWGSDDWFNQDPEEAAQAGDTVAIVGGSDLNAPRVYGTDVIIKSRLTPVYEPANSGEPGRYLTILPIGYVQLAAHRANAPLLGGLTRDYIKWFSNRANSRFIIECDATLGPALTITAASLAGTTLTVTTSTAHNIHASGDQVHFVALNTTPPLDGLQFAATIINATQFSITWASLVSGGTTGTCKVLDDVTKADTSICNPRPDTGPVLVGGTGCWFEGIDLDGGPQTDYLDNYPGFRFMTAQLATLRRCYIASFHNANDTGNGVAIQMYDSFGCRVEFNTADDCGAGITQKNAAPVPTTMGGHVICFNKLLNMSVEGFASSFVTNANCTFVRSDIYQNVMARVRSAFTWTGEHGLALDVYFNNTAWNIASPSGAPGIHLGTGNGGKFWNNVLDFIPNDPFHYAIEGPMPAAADLSFEHNVYGRVLSDFYTDTTIGDRTFAQYLSDWSDQDGAAPAATDGDPLLVDPENENFHLQSASSSAWNQGRHPDTGAVMHAGASLTGTEVFGVEGGA